jgi:hypothetical protein
MGAVKTAALRTWKDSGYFWVEDHPNQAQAGLVNGLKPILIRHNYNTHAHDNEFFTTVSNITPWEEIYNIVLNAYK